MLGYERLVHFRERKWSLPGGFTSAVKGKFRGNNNKNGDYSIPFRSTRATVSPFALFVPGPAAAPNVEGFIIVAFVSYCASH